MQLVLLHAGCLTHRRTAFQQIRSNQKDLKTATATERLGGSKYVSLPSQKQPFSFKIVQIESVIILSKSQPALGGAKDLYASNGGLVKRRGISVGHREISLC